MVRPYSLDLRERVIAAVEADESCRAVAVRFGVAVSTVVKWSSATGGRERSRPASMAATSAIVLNGIARWSTGWSPSAPTSLCGRCGRH